ncbi:MAG: type II toxin-antitoxin system RelE/ParE family toxin [Candidatus Aenigmarchaeota archaeon]|nr:type II toxin-antitoxin system RelE/ParE family toxin [Candidatus Aenigmarchaeota archaeon]
MAERRQIQDARTDKEGKRFMMYSIIFSPASQKQFDKLENPVQDRITAILDRIRNRPYDFIKRIAGSPYFKLCAGDYRVVLDVKNNQLLIIVIEVGHRRNIYK